MVNKYYSNPRNVANLKRNNIEIGAIYHYDNNKVPYNVYQELVRRLGSVQKYNENRAATLKARAHLSAVYKNDYEDALKASEELAQIVVPPYQNEDGFEWVLYDEKNTTILNRLQRWIYNNCEINIKPYSNIFSDVLSQSGGDVRDIYFTFTDDFSKPAKAFGHSGSCWWNNEQKGRTQLLRNGGLGMRLYASQKEAQECPDDPIGRAWVLPYSKGFLLFNTYGRIQPSIMVEMLCNLVDMHSSEKVNFDLTRSFINGGQAYFISKEKRDKDHYRLSGGRFKVPLSFNRIRYLSPSARPTDVKYVLVYTDDRYYGRGFQLMTDIEECLYPYKHTVVGVFSTFTVAMMRYKTLYEHRTNVNHAQEYNKSRWHFFEALNENEQKLRVQDHYSWMRIKPNRSRVMIYHKALINDNLSSGLLKLWNNTYANNSN